MARIGVVAANMSGLTFPELQDLAKSAEAAGFESIFSPEFMNDSLMNCQIMAQATSRIKVGTWIANIYLRHPALCAQTAIAIDDTSHGRLILGLGVSHRPIVEGLYQEKMEKPRTFMRQYIGAIRDMAAGKELPGMAMQPRAATHHVPIYIAALGPGHRHAQRRAGRWGHAVSVSQESAAYSRGRSREGSGQSRAAACGH